MPPPSKNTKRNIADQLRQANRNMRSLKKKIMEETDAKLKVVELEKQVAMLEGILAKMGAEMVSQDSIHADEIEKLHAKVDTIIDLMKGKPHG